MRGEGIGRMQRRAAVAIGAHDGGEVINGGGVEAAGEATEGVGPEAGGAAVVVHHVVGDEGSNARCVVVGCADAGEKGLGGGDAGGLVAGADPAE